MPGRSHDRRVTRFDVWCAARDLGRIFFNPARFFDDKLSALSGITRVYEDHIYRADIGLSLDGTNDTSGGGCAAVAATGSAGGLISLWLVLGVPLVIAAWRRSRWR